MGSGDGGAPRGISGIVPSSGGAGPESGTGSGGVSAARNELEGKVAMGWAKNIWADMLT